jgi:hypothetical protein
MADIAMTHTRQFRCLGRLVRRDSQIGVNRVDDLASWASDAVFQKVLLNSPDHRQCALLICSIGRVSRHSRFMLMKASPHEGRAIAAPIVAIPTQSRISEPLRSRPSFVTR